MAAASNSNGTALSVPGADAIEKAVELGALKKTPHTLPDGALGFVVPEGFNLERVYPVDRPESKIVRGHPTLLDATSFIAYVNKFKSTATRIFAAPGYAPKSNGQAYFRAVLDYHADGDTVGRAAHIATYQPPYSEEWKIWAVKRTNIGQSDFAEFIEENRRDIVEPDAASLLELVRKFKVTKQQSFNSIVYQVDGSQAFNWEDKVKNESGTIGVPEQLKIGLPVYFEGETFPLFVFMRYRVTEGQALFTLKPDRPDYVERSAFLKLVGRVEKETGVAVLLGAAT